MTIPLHIISCDQWPLLLCLLFLTTALIQQKIVYPLISHHPSIKSFSSLSDAMPVHFLFFNDHVSLPCNIQLCTHASQTFPWNHKETSDSEERGQWLSLNQPLRILAVTAVNITIHRQHVPKIAELIHYFYTRTITNIHSSLYFTISCT